MKSALVAAVLAATAGVAAAADDGFAAFYKQFAAAAAADDQETLAALTITSPGTVVSTFAAFHRRYLTRSARTCLAKAKPEAGPDGYGKPEYAAFCGQLIYVFTNTAAGWRLTGLTPDD